MRLLRRRPKPAPQRSETHGKTPGLREAESALNRSRHARQEISANWPAVTKRTSRLAWERERNHFAELFRAALEGGRN